MRFRQWEFFGTEDLVEYRQKEVRGMSKEEKMCFEIRGEDFKKLKKFEKKHYKCHEKYPDALCALLEYR